MSIELSTDDDGIATLTLDRPDRLNAMDMALLDGLAGAVETMAADPPRALVVAGAGAVFCAGVDVKVIEGVLDSSDTDATAAALGPLVDRLADAVVALRSLRCPTVAAVEGPAVGAGMGLALAADLRVLGRSAVFVPGYFNIAVTPDGAGSFFLARALGGARAVAAVLRNRPLDAETLAQWGLADEVCDDGDALGGARSLAREAAAAPPLALASLRTLVDSATTQSLTDQLAAEKASVVELWKSDDYREGVTAFLERRPPRFTGR